MAGLRSGTWHRARMRFSWIPLPLLLPSFGRKGQLAATIWATYLSLLFLIQDAKCKSYGTNHVVTHRLEGFVEAIQPRCLSPWRQGRVLLTTNGFIGEDNGNVSCCFISAALYPQIARLQSNGLIEALLRDEKIDDLMSVSDTSCPWETESVQLVLACYDLFRNCGIWLPILIQQQLYTGIALNISGYGDGSTNSSPHQQYQGVTKYITAEIGWKNRLFRSGVRYGDPSLLVADVKSSVLLMGAGFMSPASCTLIAKKKKRTEAIPFNSTVAACEVEGHEGDSILRFEWGDVCSEDVSVQFIKQPNVVDIRPDEIPRWGKTMITLQLAPYAHEKGRPFVPQENTTSPSLKISDILYGGASLTVAGEMSFISDSLWEATFNVVAKVPHNRGIFSIELALNGRDYFKAAVGLKVDGPYVGLLSPVDGAEEGLSSLIRVGLSHPISKHISATLSLVEPVSDKIHLVKDSVTWKPGESGEKAFELKADENATEGHAKLLPLSVKLGEVVNADIHYGQNAEKILLLKKGQMPHFRVQPGKDLYPGDGDASFTVELIRGLDNLGSVLRYSVHIKKGSALGCGIDRPPIDEVSGLLAWKSGDVHQTVKVPILWEHVHYSARLHIAVSLEVWKIGRVEDQDTIIAHVYGVSKGVCPPGTKRAIDEVQGSSIEDKERKLRLTEILSMRGHGSVHSKISLVPFFSPNHYNYTAMVPSGVESVLINLENGVGVEAVRLTGSQCSSSSQWVEDPEEGWSASTKILTEGSMSVPPCILEVWWNKTSLQHLLPQDNSRQVGIDPSLLHVQASQDDDENVQHQYQIQFLQLSPPSHAVLRAVELRNLTHMVMICGPLGKDQDQRDHHFRAWKSNLEADSSYKVIHGYPRQECHEKQLNILEEPLTGSSIVVIPLLVHPNITSTKVEVSGVLLQGFTDGRNEAHSVGLARNRQNDATIPATVIQNLPEEADNMSLSFDIRVTAEDSVTTNLYKFVLGSPSSIVKVFAAGSTYDVTSSQAVPAEAGDDDSGVWPLDPFQKSHCTKCPRGMYSSAIDSPQCSPCPPGHFTDSLGSCDCQQCSPGTFTYTWTSEACRPCMLGTFSEGNGSRQCAICDQGWTTYGEGHSSCMVRVHSTDLSKDYAIIASFAVLLNGTSLEEISDMEPGVNGSGVAVLSILIRKDMSEAFNISMGDIAVTDVSTVGHRVLLVNVTTTFKVPVPDTATEEERDAALHNAMLDGDSAIWEIATNADRALQRTTKATNSHAEVSPRDVTFQQSSPKRRGEGFWFGYGMIFVGIAVGIFAVFGGLGSLWCKLRMKHRIKFMMNIPFINSVPWSSLRVPSSTQMEDEELVDATVVGLSARHRVPVISCEEAFSERAR